MKNNLGMFCGLPRLGAGVAVATLLIFSVCGAKASVLLDWSNGTLVTTDPSVSGSSPITYQLTYTGLNAGISGNLAGQSLSVTLFIAPNYNITDLQTVFTAGFLATKNVTINGYSFGSANQTGGTSTPFTVGTGTLDGGPSGNSVTYTFTINSCTGIGNQPTIQHEITFSDLQFDGIVTSDVPEPVNYALAGFGLIFIGGSAGYTLRRKLCPAKAA